MMSHQNNSNLLINKKKIIKEEPSPYFMALTQKF